MSDRLITPIASTHPTRKPFVRDTTFIDRKPGPPFAFFDETQDHLGAALHAMIGWRWSGGSEDFNRTTYPANHLGVLRVKKNQGDPAGLRFAPASSLSIPGECGVWTGLVAHTINNPFDTELVDVPCITAADYLISAKVALIGRSRLDIYSDEGFHLGTSLKELGGAAFAAGGSTNNWWTFYGGRSPKYVDTGIPCREGVYYILQIGRVAGAIRWHINGAQIGFIDSQNGDRSSGIYAPGVATIGRALRIKRWNSGPAGDGFRIDYFHRLIQRY